MDIGYFPKRPWWCLASMCLLGHALSSILIIELVDITIIMDVFDVTKKKKKRLSLVLHWHCLNTYGMSVDYCLLN